jgi:magnesium transporter
VETNVTFELSQSYLEQFREAVEQRDVAFIRTSLDGVKSEDISALLEEFDAEDSRYVLELLDHQIGADIISMLDEDHRLKFLAHFTPEELAAYLDLIETDDAADILQQLEVKTREEIIANLQNEEKARYIVELLRYEEDVAGGLMAKELIRANVNWNVVQCVEEIRRQAENVEKFYSVYVVDDGDRLLGIVPLKDIILSNARTRIADIFDPDIVSVYTYQSEGEVAELMRKYDLEAIPVINVQGRLVGRITVDDILDVITESAEEERQIMAGLAGDVEEADNVLVLTRARLPWLIVGLAGGIVGAHFIGIFEEDLAKVSALAFFIPLIIATGGNVGIQSAALVVQSLAGSTAFETSAWTKFFKTLLVSILNGIVLALLVYTAVYLFQGNRLAFVVSIALFCVVIFASLLGTAVPLLLDKLGINPAVASGPFITTACDILGIAVYFTVAHFLYHL